MMWEAAHPVETRVLVAVPGALTAARAGARVLEFPPPVHSFDESTGERRDGLGCVWGLRLAIAFEVALGVLVYGIIRLIH